MSVTTSPSPLSATGANSASATVPSAVPVGASLVETSRTGSEMHATSGPAQPGQPAAIRQGARPRKPARPLYTEEERARRDASPWTKVQGVLAALQFFVFLGSLALVLRTLLTGEGLLAANVSVVVKTLVLYTIMVTGAIWEHDVYGKYLFAPAFFWEDVVSMGVIALHTAYIVALWQGLLAPRELMLLALAAYVTYVVNAGQFIWKLRRARLDRKTELSFGIDGGPGRVTSEAPQVTVEGAR
jgi:3-vinyl bacteriochlorophyllide hydratase